MKEKEYDFDDAEQGAIVKPARGKMDIAEDLLSEQVVREVRPLTAAL